MWPELIGQTRVWPKNAVRALLAIPHQCSRDVDARVMAHVDIRNLELSFNPRMFLTLVAPMTRV